MPAVRPLRLGVNIDHVATIRNARGGELPDPVRAALLAVEAGADGITAHLREDRRHIRDDDIVRLMAGIVEAAQFRDGGDRRDDRDRAENQAARGLSRAGKTHRTHDRRRPRRCRATRSRIRDATAQLKAVGIRVSLFIAADPAQIEAAAEVGAPVIEIHTGAWCEALTQGHRTEAEAEWQRIVDGVERAKALGLEIHAGHGLDYATAEQIAALAPIVELNIGHFLIGEAVFVGLAETIAQMRAAMERGRKKAKPA